MHFRKIDEGKTDLLPLLLLADEQRDMIDRYLGRGTMYVVDDDGIKGECVVTDEGNGVVEIKNLAVDPMYQRRGYGRALIDYVATTYRKSHSVLQVGTGDSPLTVPFYERCGFVRFGVVKDFFIENYDHPIFEDGIQLVDMIYFRKSLSPRAD